MKKEIKDSLGMGNKSIMLFEGTPIETVNWLKINKGRTLGDIYNEIYKKIYKENGK